MQWHGHSIFMARNIVRPFKHNSAPYVMHTGCDTKGYADVPVLEPFKSTLEHLPGWN